VKAQSGISDGIRIGFGMFIGLPLVLLGGCGAFLLFSSAVMSTADAADPPEWVALLVLFAVVGGVLSKLLLDARARGVWGNPKPPNQTPGN
jgi:hypothetical protein